MITSSVYWCEPPALAAERDERMMAAEQRARDAERMVRILTIKTDEQRKTIRVLMLQEGRRLTVSADEAVAALLARADEDGALHRDAMHDVLKKLGAR